MRCLPSTRQATDRLCSVQDGQLRCLDTGATPPMSRPVLNTEFCHAREEDQQLNPGTTALPELRAAHAPGSKDATV
jgi:hypothetical protein